MAEIHWKPVTATVSLTEYEYQLVVGALAFAASATVTPAPEVLKFFEGDWEPELISDALTELGSALEEDDTP